MITKIETLRFRSLRYISQNLGRFHILVGPNASGKTTFLEVITFLKHLVLGGTDEAVQEQASSFHELLWMHRGQLFELAVEAKIPDPLRERLKGRSFDTIRYEVGLDVNTSGEVGMPIERAFLVDTELIERTAPRQRALFPDPAFPPKTLQSEPRLGQGRRRVLSKSKGIHASYASEVTEKAGKGWIPTFRIGPKRSALANLPEDESRFPVSTWFKRLLSEQVQSFVLNSRKIRQPSAPGQGMTFKTDGSNLPWVIHNLRENSPDNFRRWIKHLQTAYEDILDVDTEEKEETRHRYITVLYRGSVKVPSWMVSDGTLRLLALTLPAYIPDSGGIYLVEEPENGIHPRAMEPMFQSLSSIYGAQVLLATHSPVVLSLARLEDVLCFAKNEEGATDIVLGTEHPMLREWKGQTNLGEMFASGVLG